MADSTGSAQANADQLRYWNSASGERWVEFQEPLDTIFMPVNELLLDRAAPAPGEQALDVGCGTGALARALALRIGAQGHVVAVDISLPLLSHATRLTPPALAPRLSFVEADAQTHRFPPGRFDLLVSRFGTMFFEEPVAAFRNMRRALRPGGRLHLAAWGPIEANPWFAISRDAAVARLGRPPPAPPTAPGPLAFADTAYVLGILAAAGFTAASADPVAVSLEPPGDLDAAALLMSALGPAARIMASLDGGPDDARAIRAAIVARLVTYRAGTGLKVPGLLNLFAATAP